MSYVYAELNEDQVVKAVLRTPDAIDAPHMIEVLDYDTTLIGQRYLGDGEFEEVAGPAIVPQSVDMAQARLALLEAGHIPAVEALIATMSQPDRAAAEIEWEFRPRVRRNSPLVQYMIAHLPLTEQEADALFIEAAKK